MLVPYLADVSMTRWPLANWVLIALTIVISVAMFGPLDDWHESAHFTVQVDGGHARLVRESGESSAVDYFMLQPGHFRITQLLGSAFIHAGIIHLLGNMLFLWVFGNAINAKLGDLWYVVFYLGAAVFEGSVYMLLGPRNPCLGASGAIMGVVGAFLILYPKNDIRVFFLIIYRPGTFSLSAMWLIALYLLFDLWGLVAAGSSAVAYISHVAGAAFGIGGMGALLYWGKIESDRNEENMLQMWGIQRKAPVQILASRSQNVPPIRTVATGRSPSRKQDLGPIRMD
jgi:membrane associated rhomboid family serine protease